INPRGPCAGGRYNEHLVRQRDGGELRRRGVRGREEDDLRALFLQTFPVLPPVDVETDLNADGPKIGLEHGRIRASGCDALLEFLFGGVDLVEAVDDLAGAIQEDGRVISAPV